MLPELVRRGVVPDVVTDQTSAHDALNGYVPNGMPLAEAVALRADESRRDYRSAIDGRDGRRTCAAMLRPAGARRGRRSTTATTSARRPQKAGVADAFEIPGFVPEYIRPLFCLGKGPFRWAALSGDPGRHRGHRRARARDVRRRRGAVPLDPAGAAERVAFQGLPARIFWLGYGERARFGLAINDLVRRGVVKAPIVIGRDHLDTGSVASPNRETEHMRDGSDAIADWPVLNALLNTSSGATWVSVHHGGGVGIGYSLHAGMVDRRRRHARGRREAPARAHVRSGHAASCGMPTPAIRRRSPRRGTTALPCHHFRVHGGSAR